MKKHHFGIVLAVLIAMSAVHFYAYSIDVQVGSYNQQQISLATAIAFGLAALLFGIFIPIKRK